MRKNKRSICRFAKVLCFSCLFFFLSLTPYHISAEENLSRPSRETRPKEGMSVDEFMKVSYHIKYVKDCKDYYCVGGIYLVDKKGFERKRRWKRYRIILDRLKDGIEYKDMIVITSPQNIKGLAILTWTYLDPKRDQDVWLWLPSLRKIRRMSQSESDDSFFGSDWTYEEVATRKWENETYHLLGEQDFPGYTSRYTHEECNRGTKCYLVEAKPKKKDWYYMKRNIYLEKETARNIFEELYNNKGVKIKIMSRFWGEFGGPYATEDYIEVIDTRTQHMSNLDVEEVKYDQGIQENFFTERTLMRSKW